MSALQPPENATYDIVIVGGAIMGASAAWFLSDDADFNGSVLVVEKDTSYEFSSTMKSNSCIRQQFSSPLNGRHPQHLATKALLGPPRSIAHFLL